MITVDVELAVGPFLELHDLVKASKPSRFDVRKQMSIIIASVALWFHERDAVVGFSGDMNAETEGLNAGIVVACRSG